MTTLKKIWEKFQKEFWDSRCCPYPCINFTDGEETWLEGAKAFYDFIVKENQTVSVKKKEAEK